MIFKYSLSDGVDKVLTSDQSVSEFDTALSTQWNMLHDTSGVFRYKLKIRKEKKLQGKFGFILQLNPERAGKRRTPDSLLFVKQDFDPHIFNFNKISEIENIMEIKCADDNDSSKNKLIINASPICFGHSLICPGIEECFPQVITLKSLELMMHILFLSSNRYMRIGFNSLCAMASVNHLHYHIITLEHELPAERVHCSHLKGPVFITDEYPAKGFCFQLNEKSEINKVANDVFKLTSYLTDRNIAHNLYAMRGQPLVISSIGSIWRVFVWARENYEGAKELKSINVAICEFSGHFPVKSDEEFDMSEEELSELLQNATSDTFNSIIGDVCNLFSD